jgi:hypothetical protein
MSSFDGTIRLTDSTVQVGDKGKRNEDKELVLKHFPEFAKNDLDVLDKNNALSVIVKNINEQTKSSITYQPIKPASKPGKPVQVNLKPRDMAELAFIACDFESSDHLVR